MGTKRTLETFAEIDPCELPSDVEVALQYLRTQFLASPLLRRLPPMFLVHELYGVVKDRTIVDVELDSLKRQNKIRVAKLASAEDDFVVVLSNDFETLCRSIVNRPTVSNLETDKDQEEASLRLQKGTREDHEKLISNVLTKLCPRHAHVTISKQLLLKLVYYQEDDDPSEKVQFDSLGPESAISFLVHNGFLQGQKTALDYWLSVPRSGAFVKIIREKRKEILAQVKKAKYGELLLCDMLKKRGSKNTVGDLNFTIRDVVGKGLLKRIDTSRGILLKL